MRFQKQHPPLRRTLRLKRFRGGKSTFFLGRLCCLIVSLVVGFFLLTGSHTWIQIRTAKSERATIVSLPIALSTFFGFESSISSARSADISSREQSHQLPAWIENYLDFHTKTRQRFPGSRIFTDPDAPGILLRTCLGLCGGLNDRIGQLPWDLYLANQTNRILLMHWHRPVAIEEFLVPNILDWSVPRDIPGFFPQKQNEVRVPRETMKYVRAYKSLFEGYDESQPETEFWQRDLDESLKRANGEWKSIKILRHRVLGHINEAELERRLLALGEDDMIHDTPSFGMIFRLFFRPSPGVGRALDAAYKELQLSPGMYSAVHCRVRHPKATPKDVHVKGKNEDYTADKTGLPWDGEMRKFAIQTATRAIRCAEKYFHNDDPIYFFSDSNDLVRYMAHELSDPQFVTANASIFRESPTDAAALEVARRRSIVSRSDDSENAHIDKQKGRDPLAYYSTFVDLCIAIQARCLAYGVGYYAVLATKISGISCKVLYQEEQWGGSEYKKQTAPVCELPS
jgi:hypothetical protein